MFKFEDSSIRQSTNGTTLAVGVAATETVVLDYTQPQNSGFKIRQGDTISLLFKSTTPTEISATSNVRIVKTDALGKGTQTIAEGDYGVFAEFTDRNKKYVVAQSVPIEAGQHIKLLLTADLAAATLYTRAQITGQLGYNAI